jgi:hypothetical protein
VGNTTAAGKHKGHWNVMYNSLTCIPVSGSSKSSVLMSESLHVVRIWVPTKLEDTERFEMEEKPQRSRIHYLGETSLL